MGGNVYEERHEDNMIGEDKAATAEAAKTSTGTLGACCLASLIVPGACIALALGLMKAEPNLDIFTIWAPDRGDYAKDKEYLEDLRDNSEMPESGRVSCLFTSYPRDGGSHLTNASLTELVERMKAMEAVTIEYKGNTFSYNDGCSAGASNADLHLGYTLPCVTITAVHAYKEGGWEMDKIPSANEIWYQELVPLEFRPLIDYFLLSTDFPPVPNTAAGWLGLAALGVPRPEVDTIFGTKEPATCIPEESCSATVGGAFAAGGVAAAAAVQGACCIFECKQRCLPALGEVMANPLKPDLMKFEDERFADCMKCMIHGERALFTKLGDPVYANAFGFNSTSYGDWTFSSIHHGFIDADGISYKDVWLYDKALLGVQEAMTGGTAMTSPVFEAFTLSNLFGIIKGTTNTFNVEATDIGLDKGTKSVTKGTEAQLHEWASGGISGWNPTFQYPERMMFGRNKREDDADNGNLTNVEGLQAVYFLQTPKYFVQKVAATERADGPGAREPVTITEDDATEILTKLKQKMEEVWTENWDDSSSTDVNKYAAFTGGGGGTFQRALKQITEDSLIPSAVSYGVIVVISVLLMFSPAPTESKMLVSVFGALFSIVAFSAALGLNVLLGEKLMFTSVWTLPFLMVGLGVDDMYVILTTLIMEGGNTAAGYVKAMKGCLVPVTMTSVTNAGMFAMLMFVSVPAVREMGKIAMIAIGLQYLVMVTAFPCICYLDMVRTSGGRLDCLCCLKGTRRPDAAFKNLMFEWFYKPVLRSMVSRILIVLVSLGAVGVGVYGYFESEAGGGLKDFFQPGSVEYEYMLTQEKYFDVSWPLTVNFGELEYTNPEVQMHMIDIYEKVIATPYSTKVSTETLWTASLALWGTVDCMKVGKGEKCGMDQVDPVCSSVWAENTRSLKLDTADPPGVCKLGSAIATEPGKEPALQTGLTFDANKEYCPVFDGWTDEQLAKCIGLWHTRGTIVSSYGLGAPLNLSAEYESTPAVPIKRSAASGGSLLYNIGISGVAGYVDAIKTTRKLCDEDDSDGMHCWLQGVTYDFWEQYIDLYETAGFVAACAGAAGFVIAFIFLVVSFMVDTKLKAGIGGKIVAALFGSFSIVLICAMAITAVFGIVTLAGSAFTVLLLMSVLTAIGFSVEYSVHITHRFLTAPQDRASPGERVEYAMELLSLPMGCGFAASVAGLLCLLMTDSNLVIKVFFIPLITVQVVCFVFGTLFLPAVLACIPFSCLHIGPDAEDKARGTDAEDMGLEDKDRTISI